MLDILPLFASISASLSIMFIVMGISQRMRKPNSIQKRLAFATQQINEMHTRRNKNPLKKTIKSFNSFTSGLSNTFIPLRMQRNIMEIARFAGKDDTFVSSFILIRFLLTGSGVLLFLLLFILSGAPVSNSFIISALMGFFMYMFPVMWLKNAAKRRQIAIRKDLPDTIDLLILCLESIPFDQSLQRVIDKSSGAIKEELLHTRSDMNINISRSDALKAMADRVGIDEIRMMTSAIIQAEKYGTPLANALQIQADDMRTKRRQRAETMARQATVKMMFPTVAFIFPPLLLIMAAPILPKIILLVNPGAHI